MSGANDAIWVVIPAYDESATIGDVTRRALAMLPHVVVVDDGSTDGTCSALAGVPAELLRNETNRGKGASIVRGCRHALSRGAVAVITLDADGQHRPEDIPLLIEAARQRPRRIVIAARTLDAAAAPKSRRRANMVADFWIGWAAGHRIVDSQSGFRLYPAELLASVHPVTDGVSGFVFESEILIRGAAAGFLTTSVAIPAIYPPAARASHFRPVRDIVSITRMVAWQLICKGLHPAGLWRSLGGGTTKSASYRASRLGR